MNSDSSNSPDIRLVRITTFQEVLIRNLNKTKKRKYAEKPKPRSDSEENNLPLSAETSNLTQEVSIRKMKERKYAEKRKPRSDSKEKSLLSSLNRDETDNAQKPVRKKKKVKDYEESVLSSKKTKTRNKLDNKDNENSIVKSTHVPTESFNNMEKRKKKKRNTQYDELTIDMNVAPKNDNSENSTKIIKMNKQSIKDKNGYANTIIEEHHQISIRKKKDQLIATKESAMDFQIDEFNDIVVSRKRKKNKENSNDETKCELNSSKDLQFNQTSFEPFELDNSRTNSKHISKDKILEKSRKVSDDLSPISRSSDETNDNLCRKRKRSHEHSRSFPIEDILHKSKKAKSNPYTSKYTGKDIKNKSKENNRKIKEELIEEERLANEPFENRLRNEYAKDAAKKKKIHVQIKSEDVDRSGRDIPFDNIIHKLIKNRKKIFDDKQIFETVYRNQEVGKELQETVTDIFCKKNEHIIESINSAGTENIWADTEDKSLHSKKKSDKALESHRKGKKNPVSIKIEPSCVVEDKANTYRSSKKKNLNANEEISIVKEELEITDHFATTDQLSVKVEDDTNGYINGIKLSTLQLSSLKGLIVTLPFIPHPVHTIETKLTNRPKAGQRKEIEALGYKLLTKFYSSSEDTKILNNWKEFCERHTLDEDPGPFLVPNKYFPYQERVKFAQYLARGLEHRTLASVYKRFRLLLSTHLKKGKFSKEEDRIIFEHIALAEQQGLTKKGARVFAKLATILHRGRLQIEKHYITLCKEKRHKMSIKSCDTLIKNLIAVVGKEDVTELANCEITLSHWKTLEALLGHPYDYLKSYWRNTVYPKLFNESYKNMFAIQKDMTRILQEEKIQDWKVIDWDKITQRFKGQTSLSLYKSYKSLVYNKVPRTKRMDLAACIAYLASNYFDNDSKWFCYKTALRRISQDDNGDYQLHNI